MQCAVGTQCTVGMQCTVGVSAKRSTGTVDVANIYTLPLVQKGQTHTVGLGYVVHSRYVVCSRYPVCNRYAVHSMQ